MRRSTEAELNTAGRRGLNLGWDASSTTVRAPCTRHGPATSCRRHVNFDLAAAQGSSDG
jgi:hypothetical protein